MCRFFEWGRYDDERQEARELFQNALTQEFNKIYGTDVNKLASWQALCRVLEISPVPDELKECRAVSHFIIIFLARPDSACSLCPGGAANSCQHRGSC